MECISIGFPGNLTGGHGSAADAADSLHLQGSHQRLSDQVGVVGKTGTGGWVSQMYLESARLRLKSFTTGTLFFKEYHLVNHHNYRKSPSLHNENARHFNGHVQVRKLLAIAVSGRQLMAARVATSTQPGGNGPCSYWKILPGKR